MGKTFSLNAFAFQDFLRFLTKGGVYKFPSLFEGFEGAIDEDVGLFGQFEVAEVATGDV